MRASNIIVSTLRIVPLLIIPLAIFMIGAATSQTAGWVYGAAFSLDMFSGVLWTVSYGDLFVFFSLLVLFVEIIKAVHTDTPSILNRGLSTVVALVCIILFTTSASFTNSAFFLLITMTIIDVIAGFVITIVAARRDFGQS